MKESRSRLRSSDGTDPSSGLDFGPQAGEPLVGCDEMQGRERGHRDGFQVGERQGVSQSGPELVLH